MKKETKAVKHALNELLKALNTLAVKTDETHVLDYLESDPATETEIMGTGYSLAEILYLAYRLSHPTRETDIRNLNIAISRMELDGIFYLQDMIFRMKNVCALAGRDGFKDVNIDKLKEDAENIREWINDALYERVQTQHYYIEENENLELV